MTIFKICKELIEKGKFKGLKEKMGILLLGEVLAKEEFTQLIAMLPSSQQVIPIEQPKLEEPVEVQELLK